MKKSFIVAYYTFKEVMRSKVIYAAGILLLTMLLITYVAYSFAIGDPKKIALDFGFGVASLASLAISILIGVTLVAKELEERTVYNILAAPVSRTAYLFGRLLGLILFLILNSSILTLFSILFFLILGGAFSPLMIWAMLFQVLESVLVLLIVVFFSLMTTRAMSVVYTLVIYIAGYALSSTAMIFAVKSSAVQSTFLKILTFILPNFSRLNIKEFILYKQSLPMDYLATNLLYALSYMAGLFFILNYSLNKKELR